MRLLVSAATPDDARAALEGGADMIDAKDPSAGALGAVSLEVLLGIHASCGGARPVTAALGDAEDEARTEHAAERFAAAGTRFVKVGLAGTTSRGRASAFLAAAVRGATARGPGCGVVAVAYADADRAESLAPAALPALARAAGAVGVLLDTSDKQGPGLLGLWSPDRLAAWVTRAREAGLLVALAGKLEAGDLACVRETGADIVGVRGAACDGGRAGRVSAVKVRELRALLSLPLAQGDDAD